jgi:succinate dehydrogenase/fumarate reductase flavoprotein subunit
MRLTNGNALIARLAKSAFDLEVPIFACTELRRLIVDQGSIRGVEVAAGSKTRILSTRVGVVLAGGGFPLDHDRQQHLFPHVRSGGTHCSPASPGNTGDTLRAAVAVGGVVDEGLSSPAAWIPVSLVPRGPRVGVFPHLIDRYKPGVIAVDAHGRRFVNEANSYHEVGKAMLAAAERTGQPFAWLICDHRALRRYGLGHVKPFPLPVQSYLKSGYLLRGETPADLARAIDVDPLALASTIESYNREASTGRDAAFGRGETAYNRYLGDPEHQPNPCVAPLASTPLYAIKMVMGDLGTFAGLKSNEHGNVLDRNGQAIPGLYVAGNDMSSIMGGSYPAGGITLGPAMTFGFIAAQSLMARSAQAQARASEAVRTGGTPDDERPRSISSV